MPYVRWHVTGIDRGDVFDTIHDAALVLVLPRLRADPSAEVDTTEHDTRSAWAGLVCRIVLDAPAGEA